MQNGTGSGSMNDKHWAIFALRDIQNALDREKYDVAAYHIDDAINAIISMDDDGEDMPDAYLEAGRRTMSRRV
jgi:hypothetical protein